MTQSDINLDLAANLLEDKGVADITRPRTALRHWEPRVKVKGDEIEFSSGPLSSNPKTEEAKLAILRRLLPPEFDISQYELQDDKAEFRTYDQLLGDGEYRQTFYIKGVAKIKSQFIDGIDVAALAATLRKRTIKLVPTDGLVPRAGIVQWTDMQTGQSDDDGVKGLIKRSLEIPALVKQFVKDQKRMGKPLTEIFVPVTGDLVEGVAEFYKMQTYSVELDRRQQVRLATELLLNFVTELATIGLPVHVAAVPGNHGENRQGGKAYTTIGDNDDLAVVENVQRTMEFSGRYENVRFSIPQHQRYSLVTEVLGHRVSLTHGHLGAGGVNVEAKMRKWASDQREARDPVGDFDVLFSGHYHHQRTVQLNGNRWWIMGAAMCGISEYFSQNYGMASAPGITFYTMTEAQPLESSVIHTFATPESTARGMK